MREAKDRGRRSALRMGPPAHLSQIGQDSEICSRTEETPHIHQGLFTTDHQPGPRASVSSDPYFQRGNTFLPLPFLRRPSEETHPSEPFLCADMLREISVPTQGPQGKGQNPNSWGLDHETGKVREVQAHIHHSPRYLELLNVPNFHRPRAIFHDHRLYP